MGEEKKPEGSKIPKKYKHLEVEAKWAEAWEKDGTYSFDDSKGREESFVVDTPPPTVSGSLHIGHVFSYTHTDLIVRYQRMNGKNILYPMGWDDNGLPTERRVQNKFAINCNPELPYDAEFKPEEATKKSEVKEVSRKNFVESCSIVTHEDERAFEELWRTLGLSVDWSQQYETIGEHARLTSQYSFLDLVEKGYVYQNESPTMWDVDFKTALAQADLEDREKPGAYHDIEFSIECGGSFIISTTRPELLVSCIAVVAHPDDERFKPYFGKNAITPLFSAVVPILPSPHADPEKGTGIMMVCTFGDAADVDWWKTSSLPIKQSIGRDGRMLPLEFGVEPFNSQDKEKATKYYEELVGKKVHQARKRIAELLAEDGSHPSGKGVALKNEPKQINHPVKFYEKGDRPIEFITTRQWFIKILEHKEALLAQGEKITWHPEHMKVRYQHWVEGLNQDWCISRQRFFGVPFPVWYKLDENAEVDYSNPIFANKESLPVDPYIDVPEGYAEEQRGKANGFVGDPDVMDTWATSSLTPQIATSWAKDSKVHKNSFPMDIRPQSHEIIRTWAFYTICKAWMHENQIPWKNVVISGWILDPDRKKMSKSKGNVIVPTKLLEDYSSDAVRYWAARAKLGVDTAYDESVFKNGRKLSTKLFNASKFVLSQLAESEINDFSLSKVTEPLDIALLEGLKNLVKDATEAFQEYEYSVALSRTESSFWNFCDNYLELVKVRAYQEQYGDSRISALITLKTALSTYLRLFAPTLPFITEEVWSWLETSQSIHKSSWPKLAEFEELKTGVDEKVFELASQVVASVRSEKSNQQKSLKWPVSTIEISASDAEISLLKPALADVARASNVEMGNVSFLSTDSGELLTKVVLGETAGE